MNREKAPGKPELYHVSTDLAEQRNLSDQHPAVVDELLPLMKQWWR